MRITIYLLIVLTVVLVSSCKVAEMDLVGQYTVKKFPKSTLSIKADSTFEFNKNYRNPYLHSFEHPDEYYFRTTGNWTLNNNTLILNSLQDSLEYDLYEVKSTDTSNSNYCSYVFYDIFNDTVPILVVKTGESEIRQMHGSMDSFSYDKTKHDTLQFYFYGYKPIKIVNSQFDQTNLMIYLQPEFKASYFNDTKFKVTKRKLKLLANGTILNKSKISR